VITAVGGPRVVLAARGARFGHVAQGIGERRALAGAPCRVQIGREGGRVGVAHRAHRRDHGFGAVQDECLREAEPRAVFRG
jgi:hypothetical protein